MIEKLAGGGDDECARRARSDQEARKGLFLELELIKWHSKPTTPVSCPAPRIRRWAARPSKIRRPASTEGPRRHPALRRPHDTAHATPLASCARAVRARAPDKPRASVRRSCLPRRLACSCEGLEPLGPAAGLGQVWFRVSEPEAGPQWFTCVSTAQQRC
jgi:hypothetical protein